MFSVLSCLSIGGFCFFFFKQKTAYEMRISDWSSDVCSSDLSASRGFARSAASPCGQVADRTAAWSSLHPLCWPQPSFRQRLQLRKNLGGGALNIFRKIDLDPRQTRDVFEDRKSTRLNSSH